MSFTKSEPVALGGLIVGVVQSAIVALIGFHIVHWSTDQTALVLSFVTTLIAAVTAVARSRVTPVAAPAATVPLTLTTTNGGN